MTWKCFFGDFMTHFCGVFKRSHVFIKGVASCDARETWRIDNKQKRVYNLLVFHFNLLLTADIHSSGCETISLCPRWQKQFVSMTEKTHSLRSFSSYASIIKWSVLKSSQWRKQRSLRNLSNWNLFCCLFFSFHPANGFVRAQFSSLIEQIFPKQFDGRAFLISLEHSFMIIVSAIWENSFRASCSLSYGLPLTEDKS